MKFKFIPSISAFILVLFISLPLNGQIQDVLVGGGSEILAPAQPSTQSSLNFGYGYYGNIQTYFTPNIAAQVGIDVKALGNTPYINLYLGGVLRPSQLDTEIVFPYFSFGFGGTNTTNTLGFYTFGEVGLYISRVVLGYNVGYYAGDLIQSVRFGYAYLF